MPTDFAHCKNNPTPFSTRFVANVLTSMISLNDKVLSSSFFTNPALDTNPLFGPLAGPHSRLNRLDLLFKGGIGALVGGAVLALKNKNKNKIKMRNRSKRL